MKSFFTELLSDKGLVSAGRLMSLVALFSAVGIAVYGIHADKDLAGVAEICAVFVSGAFGGKVASKYIETKSTTDAIEVETK